MVEEEEMDKVNQTNLACPAPEEMRPINNTSPWYSVHMTHRYEQMEQWRDKVEKKMFLTSKKVRRCTQELRVWDCPQVNK